MPVETLRPRKSRPRTVEADPIIEVRDRVRRLETRITQFLVANGIPTQSQKPRFIAGMPNGIARLELPSRHSSMQEILDNIPNTWDGVVGVFVGDDLVATIEVSGNRR